MTFYNLLLRLYPKSFLREYGGEMRALFARRLQQTRAVGLLPLWLGAVAEVAGNAAAVHMDILWQDVQYTSRVLRRAPGFAITAIAIVALGIGATTAAFSVTDFVLLRPLPFPEPDRLVTVVERTPGYDHMELSAPNYRDWKTAATSFESMGIYHGEQLTVFGAGEPRRWTGVSVSADLLPTLGVAPITGRGFTEADDREGAPGTIVISYRLWQTEFGGDPGIVGRALSAQADFDAALFTVIGVMPREFRFPNARIEFWITNRFGAAQYKEEERTDNWLNGVGRLKRGVTLTQARKEMDLIAAQLEKAYPVANKNTSAAVDPLSDDVSERSRLLLVALSGASACLLLIACANLANLLLARALARRRELAVRTAIGAGRERLVRQLMTESVLLAGVGGAVGIGIAIIAVPLLAQLVPPNLPTAAAPSIDMRVMGFAVALTVVTGLLFGLAPVLQAGRSAGSNALDGLREGSRAGDGRKERLRSFLVVAEIVASIVLLVSAGLLIRALLTVRAIDPGFKAEGVLTLRTELPMPEYRTVVRREAYYANVLDSVQSLPGVTSAAFVSFLPISSFRGGIWPVTVTGDAEAATDVRTANNSAAIRYITPGFFRAMGTPLKRGRDIDAGDTRTRPFVAVVSESFVRRYFPDQDPIGRHFTFAFADREIVGVAGDVRFRGLERKSEPQVYLSSQQVDDGSITFYAPKALAVRTNGDPARFATAVRAIIRKTDPKLPITDVQTLSEMIDLETSSRAVQVRVLAGFAAIAFVLAAVGIHGLLSFAVSQRIREIGVRLALGALPRDIVGMVLMRAIVLIAAGVVPGVLLAYAAGRSMEALLAGVHAADPMTLAGAVALAAVMTVAGALAPTVRAIRVDPMTALRTE